MAYDPTQSYVINTSALPVYVLPPEQYTQIQNPLHQQQFVQQYPDQQQVVYTQNQPYAQAYGQPQYAPVGQPAYAPSVYTNQPTGVQTVTITTSNPNISRLQRIEASLLQRGDQVPGICDCINAAFSLYGKHCGAYVLWTILWHGAVAGIFTLFAFSLISIFGYYRFDPTWYAVGSVVLQIFIFALHQGFYWATINVSRSENAEMKGAYWVQPLRLQFLVKVYLLGLIISFIVMFGFLLLIIPAIYWGVCYMFSIYLLHEYEPHGLGFSQAMTISKTVVAKNWCFWFGFTIVIFLLSLVPFLFPVGIMATIIAFRDTFGLIEQHDVGDLSVAL